MGDLSSGLFLRIPYRLYGELVFVILILQTEIPLLSVRGKGIIRFPDQKKMTKNIDNNKSLTNEDTPCILKYLKPVHR